MLKLDITEMLKLDITEMLKLDITHARVNPAERPQIKE
jgi:hypothetical protein